jgi:uncharacterized protein YbaA (DUF1428 family)
MDLADDEVIVFGWVVFPSKEVRDEANKSVPEDSRMTELVTSLVEPERFVFDAKRMVYGRFEALIQSNSNQVG